LLKDKAIKTVVTMGTQAQTSVLHTAGAAALRGFKVIVPVDGMSADKVFPGTSPMRRAMIQSVPPCSAGLLRQ